ncbi:MAG: hypothetical protein COB02_06550 [Candidatus Cloacimonadota bacterium]|nr:MAG: hypothetical protein COB02_06550 [Candidatus Cloacimonadota bacterium]
MLIYILLNSSFNFAQNLDYFESSMKKSIESEKVLASYHLDKLSKQTTQIPIQNHISKLKWLSRTQLPQYLTEKKAIQIGKGSLGAKSIGSNLFHYVITVAGIGASTALLDDYSKTGKIHFEKSLDFLSDSNFLKNSMGIFIGSTAFSILGNFLPPGIGPILKTVPSFLGAAVGLNVSQGEKINWPKVLLSSLASSAAFVALGSGGLLAIGAGIAASMVSDILFDNIQAKIKTKEDIPTYQPDYFEYPKVNILSSQKNSFPTQKNKANFDKKLLLEIQEAATKNDLLKTQSLLQSLESFRDIP